MGFRLKVDGPEVIDLGIDHIISVKLDVETPEDCNARSTDLGVGLVITGKILTALDGEAADSSLNIAKWSVVPAEDATCYRNLTVDVVNASQVVRKFSLPNAFVIAYNEEFGNTEGIGEFTLKVRQKKDKTDRVIMAGGFGL